MKRPIHRLHYKADVREPYMGNTVPIQVNVLVDEDGYIKGVEVVNPEGIITIAKSVNPKDVQ